MVQRRARQACAQAAQAAAKPAACKKPTAGASREAEEHALRRRQSASRTPTSREEARSSQRSTSTCEFLKALAAERLSLHAMCASAFSPASVKLRICRLPARPVVPARVCHCVWLVPTSSSCRAESRIPIATYCNSCSSRKAEETVSRYSLFRSLPEQSSTFCRYDCEC